MLKIDNIKLPVDHGPSALEDKVKKLLGPERHSGTGDQPRFSFRIIKRSIDARRKPELFYVYSLAVSIDRKSEVNILRRSKGKNISIYDPIVYKSPGPLGDKELNGRPVIVGAGPAGLFCAYELSRMGYEPLVIERGEPVDERVKSVEAFWAGGSLKPDSNVQFGEGGAGTFSDGKLNTGVNDKMGRNKYVLDTFISFGASEEIAYDAKPHIGTDVLRNVVRNMREAIREMGGEFLFNTRLTDIDKGENGNILIRTLSEGRPGSINSGCLVLAIGHSARDTFEMLKEKEIRMEGKAFAVGLRIQHPQNMINISQYGSPDEEYTGPASYKLTHRTKEGRNVYSFCMCPGGYVVNASSEPGRLAVNGMSYSGRKSLNANSAIIVSVDRDDFGSGDVLAGMEFQRRLEERAYKLGGGAVPIQTYKDFKDNTQNGLPGGMTPEIKGEYRAANLRDLLPDNINEAIIESIDKFGYTIEGFDREDAILAGVESRTSSPVRILRDEAFEGSIEGLYPCGEGAGYAGGITSAAMDGIRVAEAIMKKYRPTELRMEDGK